MAIPAMWFQATDALSTHDTRLLAIICLGIVVLAILALVIALIVFAAKSVRTIKRLAESVEEMKQKTIPLIDSVTAISRITESLLRETEPKVHKIADNLVETTDRVRGTAQHIEQTVADANLRTQRQVARVDGMVTAALTTTVEVVESIGNGIRVPAQKIASMAGQAKLLAEGLLARIRFFAARTPSGGR